MKRSVKTRKLNGQHFTPMLIIAGILLSSWGAYFTYKSFKQWEQKFFPDVDKLQLQYPILHHESLAFEFSTKPPKNWSTLNKISNHLISAVIVSEDGRFFQHQGYEPEAIREALEHNLNPERKVIRGGSTITQQLVKNLFLTHEKTLQRKFRELLLSIEVEKKVSKRKILETYLNIIEWGPNIYGITEAAQYHFNKTPIELTAREAAILAFLIPNPIRYTKSIKGSDLTDFAKRRIEDILGKMHQFGGLSDEDYASALKENSVSL